MDNIDYEGWADYVTDRLKEYGITDGLVLELGCGTGTMTGLLADRGYDMIGVDTVSYTHLLMQNRKHTILQFHREEPTYPVVRNSVFP